MPNWCDNRLRIIGEDSVVQSFIDGAITNEAHGEVISILHRYLPFPPALMGKPIEVPNGGEISVFTDRGYNWCLANWGCKWGDTGTIITQDRILEEVGLRMVEMYFTTPWGPPVDGFIQISKTFPELTFNLAFHEDGMGFCGGSQICGGALISDFDGELPQWNENQDEDVWWAEIEEMYANLFDTMGV